MVRRKNFHFDVVKDRIDSCDFVQGQRHNVQDRTDFRDP